jgi:hypothetical protein
MNQLTDSIIKYIQEDGTVVHGEHDHFVVGLFDIYMFDTFYKGEKISYVVSPQQIYFTAMGAFGKGLFVEEEVSLPKPAPLKDVSTQTEAMSPPRRHSLSLVRSVEPAVAALVVFLMM